MSKLKTKQVKFGNISPISAKGLDTVDIAPGLDLGHKKSKKEIKKGFGLV
jgi:hypothetical protein